MKYPHKWRMAMIAGLTVLMLAQYQNCAKTPSDSAGINSASQALVQAPADGSDQVHTIDPTNKQDFLLSFVEAGPINVPVSQAQLSVDGSCAADQESALLRWTVVDDQGVDVLTDLVPCHSATFHVDVPLAQLVCDRQYELKAQLAVGDPAVIQFVHVCK